MTKVTSQLHIKPSRNVIAMDLRTSKYAKKVIPNKKKKEEIEKCRKAKKMKE